MQQVTRVKDRGMQRYKLGKSSFESHSARTKTTEVRPQLESPQRILFSKIDQFTLHFRPNNRKSC
jgi:hypothetical protein